MKKSKFLILINILINLIRKCSNSNNLLIISISCKSKNLKNIDITINSILDQNVDKSLYKIILIISKKEKRSYIPKSILLLKNLKLIRLIIINSKINSQTRLLIAKKEYPNNPILIISHNSIFPEGWLEMFINDHKKYPNDIIAGSIQYFFNENLTIKEFSTGYKGKYFGIFNHIPNMVFNFALLNTDLGGTLFPSNSFKNKYFYDLKLFLSSTKNSDEFWQSCFIMIENLILRQSSKIYDYTEYLIFKSNNYKTNSKYQKILSSFINVFPKFKKIVKYRQNKVIISLTSYDKRFKFLPLVIKSLKNNFSLKFKILLILAEKDKKKYNLNISGIDIVTVKKDLRPHNKYYYAMTNYRDYAIITVDDDVIYTKDTIFTLYKSYIENPNIVSGRRSHLIKYKKNGEIDNYIKWKYEQKKIKKPDFNIFLTAVGGIIYPPDIFNLDYKYLNIINETITTDDITLKYIEINKGIEAKWIPNNYINGLKIQRNKMNKPLSFFNKFFNDLNIKKIDFNIKNKIIENMCINYKNINTGLMIYLFKISNINFINSGKLKFSIDAYSFCPINNKIKFKIYFYNKFISYCYFNSSYSIIKSNFNIYKTKKILRANCLINGQNESVFNDYFPKVISKNFNKIKIYNHHRYQTIIFNNFFYINNKYLILEAFFYKSFEKGKSIMIALYNKTYSCLLKKDIIYLNNKIPIVKHLKCYKKYNYLYNKTTLNLFKLHFNLYKTKKEINKIPNQFIIFKIYQKFNNRNKFFIIIKGKFFQDLKNDINNLKIFFLYPNISLFCNVNSSNRYIQSYIYCNSNKIIKSKILIENQIIYSKNYKFNLILINKETFYQNYEIIDKDFSYKVKRKTNLFLFLIINLIIFLKKKFR